MRGPIVWCGIGARGYLDSAGGDLELRDLAAWIKSSVSQTICAARASPVIREENGVGTDRFDHHGADYEIVATGGHCDPIAVFNAVLLGKARVKFRTRFWILIDQGSRTACGTSPSPCREARH